MKHKMKCGCVIAEPQGDDWQIFYCPLHAAAPEMLKALKFSLSVYEAQGQFDLSERMAVNKIEAAIAKAEGE